MLILRVLAPGEGELTSSTRSCSGASVTVYSCLTLPDCEGPLGSDGPSSTVKLCHWLLFEAETGCDAGCCAFLRRALVTLR
jgi:hypothetical protein